MDDQDAKWYGEDHSGMPHEQVSHALSHMAVDQAEHTPSMGARRPGNSSSTLKRSPDNNNNSTSRKLARLDSEQAVDAYIRDLLLRQAAIINFLALCVFFYALPRY